MPNATFVEKSMLQIKNHIKIQKEKAKALLFNFLSNEI